MSYFLFCLKHILFMAFVSLFELGFGLFSVFSYLAFGVLVNCKVKMGTEINAGQA